MTHQPENEQKPQKKGFRHHARKVHGRVTKYLYERDTIFATIWVFIFIIVLGSIPLNLGIMNPVKLGLKDFDFNDITYAKLHSDKKIKFDTRIVIVNIGTADREGLSLLIDKIASFKPRVMALDAYFEGEREPYKDSMLSATFARNKNLIVGRKLVLDKKQDDSVIYDGVYFKTAATYAHVNLFTDSMSSIRYIEPLFIDNKGKVYNSFAAEVVRQYDPEAFEKLAHNKNHKLIINYARRLDKYLPVQNYEDIIMGAPGSPDSSYFKDKIVLLGYINPDPVDLTDKFFTPMNEKFAGKSIPDMNGIVIHANIISMALDKSYIKKVPLWGNLLLAIMVCWLHMSFFIHYYLESHIWFHLAAKIAQVLSALFFVWLGIYMYDKYGLKVDMKLSIITIVMAVDVIYFYEAWAVWMHKKYNYRTVFKPHHH